MTMHSDLHRGLPLASFAPEIEVADPGLVDTPLVSVLMVTYNHASYLAEAIEGVVAQECGFQFELIIGEDFSSDSTRRIALEYQKKYPEIIRVMYSAANVGGDANLDRIFSRARGDFIAYCDGDDYWCSKDKLALQVALIQSDEKIAVVHSNWMRSMPGAKGWVVAKNSVHHRVPRRLLEGNIFATFYYPRGLRACTLLYRKKAAEEFQRSALAAKRYRFGDTVLAAYLTSKWKLAYLNAVTAIYRESPGSALRSGRRARSLFLLSALEFDTDARRFFADRDDYPESYRWELAIGLLITALAQIDFRTACIALTDLQDHFGVIGFIKSGLKAIMIRLPTWRAW